MNGWQKGHLSLKHIIDYMYGDYITYDGIAYYVSAITTSIELRTKCCNYYYIFYLPEIKRYIRIKNIEAFIPELGNDVVTNS